MNKVILIGNLGKDPEVRDLSNGGIVATLNVATNTSYRQENGEWGETTEWHRVSMWGRLAEIYGSTLKKGDLVQVEAKLTYSKNGDTYYTNIVANSVKRLSKAIVVEEEEMISEEDYITSMFED